MIWELSARLYSYSFYKVILQGSTQKNPQVFIEADEQWAFIYQFDKGLLPVKSDEFIMFIIFRIGELPSIIAISASVRK